jgi:hypothetical protein
MATNNRNQGSGNQSFKQIEGDGWLSTYLPAISAGTVMAVVLFLAISCSKKSDNVSKIKAPDAPVVASSTPATTASAVTPAPPKKIKKSRPVNATYVNGTYGVSFSYPRKYSLQAGNGKSSGPVAAGFVKPGALEIASVDMPDSSYTDTDFSSGVLNVSVNQGMTAEECAQFPQVAEVKPVAGLNDEAKSSEATKASDATKLSGETIKAADDSKPGNGQPKTETVKLGSNQFTVLEKMTGETTDAMEHQSDLKYFHTFKNGACYEFSLDVETSRNPDEDLAQVDRGKVFQQLAKILTTARIKEVHLPGMEAAEKPATSPEPKATVSESAPASDAKAASEKTAEVVTPQQK